MSENKLKKIIDNFATKVILAIIGIVGTGITVYAFLQEKKVNLQYQIIANTNVLDFNADINKLEVTYDSTNLKQTKENLRIYTIKIINIGDQNIVKEYYDENDPIGIKISSGKIIENPQLIQASNSYLTRNLKFSNFQGDKVSFSQVILESGEFYIVKLLVLHKTGSIPTLLSLGKIAGQKKIEVINSFDLKKDDGFFTAVYKGNFLVQSLRLVSYFVVGLLIAIGLGIGISELQERNKKKKRTQNINEFKKLKNYEYTKMDDAIFERYKINDDRAFGQMMWLLNNEINLNERYTTSTQQLSSTNFKQLGKDENGDSVTVKGSSDLHFINDMIEDGIVFKVQDKLVVNKVMKDSLEKFNEFLKEKKFNSKKP